MKVSLVKTAKSLSFFKSSTSYTVKDIRDVGDVPTHKLESLRSLIKNIGMLLDMVNVVEETFKIHLL
jgi:hypothetical protein